ncbi:nuclear transport factor 2 family protein [Streptomyces sp. NPDC050548]|uniref:nuclear transport factor 2 family protein n=1 Tax=Streptomyces sp. NPDC050548 TaxID=3365629 RepID=UPI00379F7A75
MAVREFAEVSAGVRATIAAHAQAQDEGRTTDMVALYLPDAVVEIPGFDPLAGADAILAAFSQPGWRPDPGRPQRHMVGNTLLTEWDDRTAKATSDVVMLVHDGSAWSVAVVARYHDTFEESAGRWLLRRRVDEYVGDPP